MFGPLIRAAAVFVMGAFMWMFLRPISDEFVSILPEGSRNAGMLDTVVTWWPGIILAAIVVILIAGAIVRRRRRAF